MEAETYSERKPEFPIEISERCPNCESVNIIRDQDKGEFVCGECGLVIEKKVFDQGPEWREFTREDERTKRRAGPPVDPTRYDKGMSTILNHHDRDAFGRPLSPEVKNQMRRLQRWQVRSRTRKPKNRNLMYATNELERMTQKLSVSKHLEKEASIIYRKALDKDLVRGRSIASMVAASLYLVIRQTKTARTLDRVAEVSLADKNEVARCYRLLHDELDIKVPLHDPLIFVSKICNELGISGEIESDAGAYIRKAREKRCTFGKSPQALAAAACYLALQQDKREKYIRNNDVNVTQKDLAEIVDISEVTLRNRYREFKEKGLERMVN